MEKKKPVMLMILDGYGNNPKTEGNAVSLAKKENIDQLFSNWPHTTLKTSGLDVGLPEGQMGNSEVGHTNIGAGRVVYQELTRITKSIQDGDFFQKTEFLEAVENCKKNHSALHLFGLLSDGGVHSHKSHLYALLELAKKHDLSSVYVHCFFDGRDVSPTSGKEYLEELQQKIKEIGVGKVATLIGRFYVMDRDRRWDRVELAYKALILGRGETTSDPLHTIEERYKKEEFDEFITPTVVLENGEPVGTVKENDSIIFYNFRPDRAREITRAIVDPTFDGFERSKGALKTHYVCMTQYDQTMPNVKVAFKPQSLKNTFGEFISHKGLKQFRIAETEKYAHVTFFFNGGIEKEYEGEDRALIPSPKVATYDCKPEMSAFEVTEEIVKRIQSSLYDVFIINFANPDMVGHTGDLAAATKAVEAVDVCVGKVLDALLQEDGIALVTADHGNAEQMVNYNTGGPHTAHTTFDVPLILVGKKDVSLRSGRLADLAPTLLHLLDLEKPEEMTGESLIGG